MFNIFTYTDDVPVLTVEEEVALIEYAQVEPNGTAFTTLLEAYGPALRQAVTKAAKTLDREEAEAEALAAFTEVVMTHDPHDANYKNGRLASRLPDHLTDRLGKAQAQEATIFTIPKRTYVRYFGILNAADGDFEKAMELAPTMSMRSTTFAEVHRMVQETSPLTHGDDEDEDSPSERRGVRPVLIVKDSDAYDEAEDYLMVEVAFKAVDDEEARIIEMAYGFTEFDPVPDAEIAHRVGGTRPTIQRKRGKALGKMRKALGVTLDGA